MADYVAMLTLSQPHSLEGCGELPSVTELFSQACSGRAAPRGFTSADAAFLAALYAAGPDDILAGDRTDIAERMADILVATRMASR